MNRPRLFLSAVSEELRTARRRVAALVGTMGFDPVSQDDFPTGYGELQEWLREQLDTCEGLIQLAGQGYGAEPPEPDPEDGRISYTQFEFLHAHRQGKKTWLILIGQGIERDKPVNLLDLPRESGHPDLGAYQTERRALQQAYLTRLTHQNHLRHTANSSTELDNLILRLRDDLGELRRQWDEWRSKDDEFKTKTTHTLDRLVEANRLTRDKIRTHLLQTVEETYCRKLSASELETDWRKRRELRETFEKEHKGLLVRIDELVDSFTEIEGSKTRTVVFEEMTRILTEQGVDETIAFVQTQRPSILQKVRARAEATREGNHRDLQPLLQTAALYRASGRDTEARILYSEILGVEPDWAEALHRAFWFLVGQGDLARIRSTIEDAGRDYAEAHSLAERLAEKDPSNTEGLRNLGGSYDRLGNVAVAQGRLDEAEGHYAQALEVAEHLAEKDPSNTMWQRDLGVSYLKLGDVVVNQGRLAEAAAYYTQGLEVAERLAEKDPSNTEWQRDLSLSYDRLGDVAVAQGRLDEAAAHYTRGLEIREALMEKDPSNTEWQRDLSLSCDRLGDIAVKQGRLDEAAAHYTRGLEIREALGEKDPSNTEWQRDLSLSYDRLGDIAVKQGRLDEAAAHYTRGLEIREALAEKDPSNTMWQRDLGVSYLKLGDVVVKQGRLAEAAAYYTQGLEVAERLAEKDPSNTEWQRGLFVSYWRLADLGERHQQREGAETFWKRAYNVLEGIHQRGLHLSPQDRQWLEILRQKVGFKAS